MSAGLRRAIALVVCAAAATACGCATVDDGAQRSSLAALATQAPPPKDYDPPQVAVDCEHNPYGSLAPDSTPPPPGRMPPGSYMRRIQDRDGRKLIVGVDQNTLRLAYFDPRRERIRGLDIELVREIAKAIFGTATGHIRFKAISTEQRISAIVSGDVDIVASAYSINCERRKSMYFSSVYYLAHQKLLVPVDSTVESLADLRGKRVCATDGSTSIDNLYGTGVKPYPVELRPDCLVELQEGRVAAITSDDSILVGFKQQDPQTKIVGSCINVERYGMAINRDNPEFVQFVNGVLKRIGAGARAPAQALAARTGCADERADRALQPPLAPADRRRERRRERSAASRVQSPALARRVLGARSRASLRPRLPRERLRAPRLRRPDRRRLLRPLRFRARPPARRRQRTPAGRWRARHAARGRPAHTRSTRARSSAPVSSTSRRFRGPIRRRRSWRRRRSPNRGASAGAAAAPSGAAATAPQVAPRAIARAAARRSRSCRSCAPVTSSATSTRSPAAWPTAGWAGSTSRATATWPTAGSCSRDCSTADDEERSRPRSPNGCSSPRSSIRTS